MNHQDWNPVVIHGKTVQSRPREILGVSIDDLGTTQRRKVPREANV
jgi:hypothetical protein